MVDWTIVGGGPAGCIIAGGLIRVAGVPAHSVTLVDPNPEPMIEWSRRARQSGMRYLRSPGAHNLEPDFMALRRFAMAHNFNTRDSFIPPYNRPVLDLFEEHARAAAQDLGLSKSWHTGTVRRIGRIRGGWSVDLKDGGQIVTAKVVMCLGPGEVFAPTWARSLPASTWHHVFEENERSLAQEGSAAENQEGRDSVIVVGGGMTAVQRALRIAADGLKPILLSRHQIRVSQFDSDPCYIGPRCFERFLATPGIDERVKLLEQGSNPGTVTPEIADTFFEELDRHSLSHIVGEVVSVDAPEQGSGGHPRGHGSPPAVRLTLDSGQTLAAKHLILATGFVPGSPTRKIARLLDKDSAGPRHTSGRLQITRDLEWMPGLYITGKAAAHEIGPSAGNLIGAHNAAKRIVSSLKGKTRGVPRRWSSYSD